jgi:hypothetical protein
VGTLSAVLSSGVTTGELIPGESYEFILALYMDVDVGSEYNRNLTPGDIGVNVAATQIGGEDDAFGPDYDAGNN